MNTPLCEVDVAEVQSAEVDDVVTFVMKARAGMFPMLDPALIPDDLANFQQVYHPTQGGRFFVARCGGHLVGAIGFLPYDGRFSQLDYGTRKVVEVVRLYVSPDFRRLGLAARLFATLKHTAQACGVEVLYLHTHPFLPGAIEFWQRQGFTLADIEDDPVWRTTHMHCLLHTTE